MKTPAEQTANQLNSWAVDIGNCKWAISNAVDGIPNNLHATGTLMLVFEKLDELQSIICTHADKTEFKK